MIRAGTAAAKKNPGSANLFNGKHWVPVERALPEFEKLSEVSEVMAEALRSAKATLLANGGGNLYAYGEIVKAIDAYEAGKVGE